MSEPSARLAVPADRDRVVTTVVAAFGADPAFRFFFPDTRAYAEQAGCFAGALFDSRVGRSAVWLVDDGAALSMWVPPSPHGAGGDSGDDSALDLGGLPDDVVARLQEYEHAVHEVMPDESHWYLGVLATHPDSAGRRLGRLAMQQGLERARAAGLPAHLETTNPGNVELYRRAGWDVTATTHVERLRVWVMRWDAPRA